VHSNGLQVENVSVRYHVGRTEQVALDDVSLFLHPSEFTLIMGPSGSGKTTLLSVLGCLLTPDAGQVTMLGQNVVNLRDVKKTEFRRNHVAFIFQAFRLLSALTALENVIVTMDIQGIRGHRARELALKALADVGLSERKYLRPDQLSGGEKQRVAIARAIATNAPIILADEPTASLDAASGKQVIELLADLAHRQERFVVMVSHDYRWKHYARRVVTLQDGKLAGDERITGGTID
jgi:putative ABC transport system ATP-binding protein